MAPRQTHFLPSKSILEQFRSLTSNDTEVRIAAAKQLILEVQQTTENKEATVEYALTRLLKGLASGSESSRLGFSMALTEFLREIILAENSHINLQTVIKHLLEHTEATSGLSGQEERDHHFGRLFGLKSLIETDVLFADETIYSAVLFQIFLLAQKKPWLRETCAYTICNAVRRSTSVEGVSYKAVYTQLDVSGLAKTPEGVAIRLVLWSAAGKGGKEERHPLSQGELTTLAKVLKDSADAKDTTPAVEGVKQKGSWNAKLPFVWDLILGTYLGGEVPKEVAPFADFWKIVVDESLFATTSSNERKFHGFLTFTRVLEMTEDEGAVSTIFSQNLMKCLINQLASPDRYLHKAAGKCLRSINAKAEVSPKLVPKIIQGLLGPNGSPNFDTVTKSKTVEKLLAFPNAEGLVSVVHLVRNIIAFPTETNEKGIEKRRQWAADQLLSLVRNSKSEKAEEWLDSILELFAEYGHFEIPEVSAEKKVSETSRAMFRARLGSCLNALLEFKELKEVMWGSKVISFIRSKEDEGTSTFIIDFDDQVQETIESAFKILKRIQKKRTFDMTNPQLKAFELLYSLVLLQVYNSDADALSVLDELQTCYDTLLSSSSKKSKRKENQEHRHKRSKHDHEEEDPSIALLEIILSFVSKPSGLLRKLAQNVFTSFADIVTEKELESMIHILETKENLEGQGELFDENDDDEEEGSDSEDDEDDELDSDVELLEGEDVESSDDDIEEIEEDEEEIEEDDEAAVALDAALAIALGTSKPTTDAMDIDSDGESLNDDQMLETDKALVKIFQARAASTSLSAQKKQAKKDAKENIIAFKTRVLELLEIYVKGQCGNTLVLGLLVPLLRVIRETGSTVVREKAQSVLRSLSAASRGRGGGAAGKKGRKNKQIQENGDNEDETSLLPTPTDLDVTFENLLKGIHMEAALGKVGNKAHAVACSQASLYVVKVLVHADAGYLEKAFALYAESLSEWVRNENGNGVQPSFFTDLVGWAGTVRGTLTSK